MYLSTNYFRPERIWDYAVIPYEIDANFSGVHKVSKFSLFFLPLIILLKHVFSNDKLLIQFIQT